MSSNRYFDAKKNRERELGMALEALSTHVYDDTVSKRDMSASLQQVGFSMTTQSPQELFEGVITQLKSKLGGEAENYIWPSNALSDMKPGEIYSITRKESISEEPPLFEAKILEIQESTPSDTKQQSLQISVNTEKPSIYDAVLDLISQRLTDHPEESPILGSTSDVKFVEAFITKFGQEAQFDPGALASLSYDEKNKIQGLLKEKCPQVDPGTLFNLPKERKHSIRSS